MFPALFALVLHLLVARNGRSWIWLAPAVWVAAEYGRLAIFGGFPLGAAGLQPGDGAARGAAGERHRRLRAVGAAGGVGHGGGLDRRDAGSRRWLGPVVVAGVVAGVAFWGQQRIARGDLTTAGSALRVGIVQGNVDQGIKWDPARADEIFARYLRLTEQVADRGARLVLWPESSTPFYFEHGAESQILRELARRRDVQLLIGSDQWEQATPPRIYNAAFLINADGTTGGVYRKVHLVPFGEYVPLKRAAVFRQAAGRGGLGLLARHRGQHPAGRRRRALSTAICYEVVYPALIREGVQNGSALLTTITNDAWFGRSSAPSQHFAMAAMRAVEQGRYLVRAANTGISGVVDPYGRVVLQSGLFVEGAWTADVRLIEAKTIYGQTGDWVVWGSLLLTALALGHDNREGAKARRREVDL